MKRYFVNLSLFFVLLMFASCGDTAGKKKAAVNVPIEVRELRDQAIATIDFRYKEDPKPAAVLVAFPWEYEFIFEKQKMSAKGEHQGRWIDFKDDGTYQYGVYDKQNGTGTFHHSFDKLRLLMVDDDPLAMPVHYETKFGSGVMILVGQRDYKTNGVQMKLKQLDKIPSNTK